MSASEASSFERITIESTDQKRFVDLRGGVISIDYFEDILSPSVTAKMRVIDTGNTLIKERDESKKTVSDSKLKITNSVDRDGFRQALFTGLPIQGGERIDLKIKDRGTNQNGEEKVGLDFSSESKKNLYVSGVSQILEETQRESFVLNLVSKEAITNEITRVYKRYTGSISKNVKNILKDPLIFNINDDTELDKIVEKSLEDYNFLGNLRKPFTVLITLASKSVPKNAVGKSAGFVFFQTQDGFQFKSIESLISKDPKANYKYTEINESSITKNNDFNILQYSIDKNQDLIDNLRTGSYSFTRFSFNPLTFEFKQNTYKYSEKNDDKSNGKMNHLGGDGLELPKLSDDSKFTLDQVPSRIISSVVDVGATFSISQKTNHNLDHFLGQNIMRYNLLNTQNVSMVVPCNTNLRAGDVINCEFPINSRDENLKLEIDTRISGKYLIRELCHHFESKRSFTSMKLIRDSYGIGDKS